MLPLFVCSKIEQSQQTTPSRVPPTHGLSNYANTKAKCRHLKKLTCKGTCTVSDYLRLQTGHTVSHVCIFDLAL